MESDRATRRMVGALVDAVWPSRCALCDARDAGDGLGCGVHWFEVGLSGPRCDRCAAPVASMLPDGERCPACRGRSLGVARVAALGVYRAGANADWLLSLKYGGRRDLAQPLGALLAARLALEPASVGPRVLVPVPLHAARRIERGYDQALLLAQSAGAAAGLSVARALRRVRATAVQGSIETASRTANVRGAFAASNGGIRGLLDRVRGRRAPLAGVEAWLVDDVVTSGATVAECARILRRLGAARVAVLCVARAQGA